MSDILKKRILPLFLAGILTLSLAACGNTDSTSGTQDVSSDVPKTSEQDNEIPSNTSEPEESGSTESDGNNILIAYSNIKNGTLISKDMGIDKILAECPHFREWIEQIRYLGA